VHTTLAQLLKRKDTMSSDDEGEFIPVNNNRRGTSRQEANAAQVRPLSDSATDNMNANNKA